MHTQLDLFSQVLHAYSSGAGGKLRNRDLYELAASGCGIAKEELTERVPVGESQQQHNLLTRKIRWHQQTLRQAGLLTRIEGERGLWALTSPAGKELNQINSGVAVLGFSTTLGIAILGSCESVFAKIDAPIVLCITSPPYCLSKERNYGNVPESVYVDWICKMLEPVIKNMVRGASLCLNVSNDIFIKGSPARSLYQERLILALNDRFGLEKMDTLVWHNPSKPPGPIQWASKKRVQLNVSYENIYWLTNDAAFVRSDNRRVLQEHTERQLKLIRQGGEQRYSNASDGAYTLRPGKYGNPTAGRIPRNVLQFGHACADQREYKQSARAAGLSVHGAPMPLALPSFLIEFLTKPGELVVDPFAGSHTTAKAAERLGRRWLTTEVMAEYVIGSAARFRDAEGFEQLLVG